MRASSAVRSSRVEAPAGVEARCDGPPLTIDGDFAAIRVGRAWRTSLELAVPLPTRRRS